jgi:hypothetical protein
MEKKKPIPIKYFTFAEVIDGLQKGKVFTRWNDGSIITMQIPCNIKPEVIPNMQSLCPKAKELLSVKKGLYYHHQVLRITPMGDKAKATYYQPTWEDIFASDWLDL